MPYGKSGLIILKLNIVVLDENLITSDSFHDYIITDDSAIQSRGVMPLQTQRRATNVSNLSNLTGSTVIASTSGNLGINLSINTSRSVANSFIKSFGARTDEITVAVGFSVIGTRSISIYVSQTVPAKHNNRNVNRMTINARPIFQVLVLLRGVIKELEQRLDQLE